MLVSSVGILLGVLIVLAAEDDELPNNVEDYWGNRREKERPSNWRSNSWDSLIFTQTWPPAECIAWLQKSGNRRCRDFSRNTQWTIHGIWPTKWNSDGPSFCDSGNPFRAEQIAGLVERMGEQWPTIDGFSDGYYFWRHEWEKHGTCSTNIRQLSSQYEYFSVGLDWNVRYNPAQMLGAGGIRPGQEYNLVTIWDTLTHSLAVDPQITCIKDYNTGRQHLQEIRICFDNKMSKMNCLVKRGVSQRAKGSPNERLLSNTNCNLYEPVMY